MFNEIKWFINNEPKEKIITQLTHLFSNVNGEDANIFNHNDNILIDSKSYKLYFYVTDNFFTLKNFLILDKSYILNSVGIVYQPSIEFIKINIIEVINDNYNNIRQMVTINDIHEFDLYVKNNNIKYLRKNDIDNEINKIFLNYQYHLTRNWLTDEFYKLVMYYTNIYHNNSLNEKIHRACVILQNYLLEEINNKIKKMSQWDKNQWGYILPAGFIS